MSDKFNDADVIYRCTPKPEDNITGCDDVAEEYAVVKHPEAYAGLVVYGKYHGEWVANPSGRHIIRYLLIETGRMAQRGERL